MSLQPVYLVDASIYIFRAWFSISDEFSNTLGQPTNAVYGFTGFLCNLLEQTRAQHVGVAFDESLTTSYRNEIYPEYKANRDPAPEELKRQFKWARYIVRQQFICVSLQWAHVGTVVTTGLIDKKVSQNTQQPGLWIIELSERIYFSKCPHTQLLDKILSILLRARESIRHAIKHFVVRPDQTLKAPCGFGSPTNYR